MDTDDEVRDRATYFYSVLSRKQAALNSQYFLEGLQVSTIIHYKIRKVFNYHVLLLRLLL